MDNQVVSSQCQNGSVKTDGVFLLRILLSGFLLVFVMGDSAFPGLHYLGQKGNQSCLLCTKSCCPEVPSKPLRRSQESCWGPLCVLQPSVRRGAGPVYSALRAAMARCQQNHCTSHKSHAGDSVVPPLGIFCSMSDQNLSESVASSSSLHFD